MIALATRTDTTVDSLIERLLYLAAEFMELTGRLGPHYFGRSESLTTIKYMPGPLSNIVDFIKPLQWIPTTSRSRGRRLHEELLEVYGALIMRVKARMDAGEDTPDCLVKTLLLNQEREKLDWEDMCMLVSAFIIGGIYSVTGPLSLSPMRLTNRQIVVYRLRVLSCGS